MPKAKNRKAAAKRFKITSSGKILRGHSGKGHLLEWKTSSKKRRLGRKSAVSHSDKSAVQKMLPAR
jgi:large subunit ribosomal protein L35